MIRYLKFLVLIATLTTSSCSNRNRTIDFIDFEDLPVSESSNENDVTELVEDVYYDETDPEGDMASNDDLMEEDLYETTIEEEAEILDDSILLDENNPAGLNNNQEAQSLKKLSDELYKLNNQTVLFGYNSYKVEPFYLQQIKSHAEFLQRNPTVGVILEGHTDERGTEDYNMSLGNKRAEAVSKSLMSFGVSKKQIMTKSYGEMMPQAIGSNEAAWRQNRRVVFRY